MYNTLTGQEDVNVTLPTFLAEWQKLASSKLQFQAVFETLTTKLGGGYWANWTLDNSTLDVYDMFLQRYSESLYTVALWEFLITLSTIKFSAV